MKLRDYQINGINEIAKLYAKGVNRIIFQLATGGGKTITFSGLIDRYRQKFTKKVLILVHREELLNQTRLTLYNSYGFVAQPVVAGMKYIPQSDIYVAMVETAYNKLKKNSDCFGDVGLLVVDECHIGNFKKIYEFFPDVLKVGFSATPITSSKRDPMTNHFDEIVCGIDIPGLIESGNLMPNITYGTKHGVSTSSLKIKNGEFDLRAMGDAYSKAKHIQNCVSEYEKHALGKKTLVFNCNVEHSKLVMKAFNEAGYKCEHLDGTENENNRRAILHWYKNTPNAILCNIGVLTTGFDEPTIEAVVINRSTKSLPLWLQMTGRGGRPCITIGKDHFIIIDLGGNFQEHGDWSLSRDWYDIFHNPDKPRASNGAAPIKLCPECDALIAAQARICPYCGANIAPEVKYDSAAMVIEKLVSNIDIKQVVKHVEENNHKKFRGFYLILNETIAATSQNHKKLYPELYDQIYAHFLVKVKEWCKTTGQSFGNWMKEFAREQYEKEMEKVFKIDKTAVA